jgi:hypothetical protein
VSGGFRLQAEAEGYLASVSDEVSYNDAGREFILKLRPAATVTGRVVTPDGSVAANADVTFVGPGTGAGMQGNGELVPISAALATARTRTDQDGKFRLQLKTGARGMAVIHESGCALVTFAAATNGPIVLQSWGAIDGTLYLKGQPAPNQTVNVSGAERLDTDPPINFYFGNMASTDERGHFHFNKVPPGEHTVTRLVGYAGGSSGVATVNLDQSAKVKVEAGAVATVDLRRDGRSVIGRIILEGSPDDIDWATSQALIEGTNKFPFAISKGGTMRADDVPPGKYTLSIQIQSVSANPVPFGKTFGSLQKEIIVPAVADETVPVNLGDLVIERAK